MNLKQVSMTSTMIFFTVILCFANQKIETRIGPFDVDIAAMKESTFIAKFGKGHVQIYEDNGKIFEKKRMFYASNEKVWVEVSFTHVLDENLESYVEAILVTKKKICDESFKPKKSFGPLITSKGIKVGDSIDKIIGTYGEPSRSFNIGKDKLSSKLEKDLKFQKGRVLRYLPERKDMLLLLEFYFDGEGVHSLLIYGGE